MKYFALIAVLFLCLTEASAQSKKAINKQLVLELSQVKQVYDSIEGEFKKTKSREDHLTRELDSLQALFSSAQASLTKKRSEFNNVGGQLKNRGFDAFTLVTKADLKVVDQITERNYFSQEPIIKLVFEFQKVYVLEYIGDKKVKVQNPMLSEKINEYKTANQENTASNREQKSENRKVESEIFQFDALLAQSRRANAVLDDGILLLKSKISDLDRVAAEEKAKRLAEEAKQPKTKKSKVPNPPVEPQWGYERKWDSDGVGSDAMPPPEPPREISEKMVEPYILEVYEESPEFPGGKAAMLKYLSENFKYPQSALDAGIQGKVYLKFVVSETGIISNVVVKRGIADCPECDQEAIRLVKNMPNWIPGKNDGKAVKCYYTLPLIFKLQ